MAATSVAALIFVAVAFGHLGSQKAMSWVGVILVLYAALACTAWRPAVSHAPERWPNPLIGLARGAVAGLTGHAAVALVVQGAFDSTNLVGAIAAIVPTFIGVWIGQKARNAVSPETFRRIFLFGMFVVGLHMARTLL